jgi:chromate reductase, NAD(P)H dehydrogenase (quinone)
MVRIVGIVGNLRKASFNRLLLRACVELAPQGMTLEEGLIEGIPLFNEDDRPKGEPEAVSRLKAVIADADGLLVFTPEYNAGVPGVLKNVVDWLSGNPCVLKAKPAGIMGASIGVLGTVRAQAQLRISLEHCAVPVMPQPQVYVGLCREQFDAEGRLSNERTRAFLGEYLKAFALWVSRNGGGRR